MPGGSPICSTTPKLPELEEYYEPFTFRYADLFTAPESEQQPTAIPVSQITGKPMEIETGPNWDDDLSGSNIYAKHDPALEGVPEDVRAQLDEMERVVFNYLPRICNHCLNPGCVAACPSGAIYKRAEDGVVLVNENKCRAWRMCVAACPYKKGLLQLGDRQVGKVHPLFPPSRDWAGARLRPLLRRPHPLHGSAAVRRRSHPRRCCRRRRGSGRRPTRHDPGSFDPGVIEAARGAGIGNGWIEAAQRSPAYKLVKELEDRAAAPRRVPHAGHDVLHTAALTGDVHRRTVAGASRPPRRADRLRAVS